MIAKASIRETVAQSAPQERPGSGFGKIAEHLRQSEVYRKAGMIFVTPAAMLLQIRMNILADNKALVMPSPRLREGFFLLKPFTVPFKQLGQSVTLGGISRHGTQLKSAELCRLPIDLVVADALAVDRNGSMICDGHGFLDLSVAILAAYGAITAQTTIVAVTAQEQKLVEPWAHDPWDVRAHGFLSANGFRMFDHTQEGPYAILWERLTLDRIKRITPLWQLYQAKDGAGTRSVSSS